MSLPGWYATHCKHTRTSTLTRLQKNKPFLSRRVSLIYIVTVILVQPYWILEIVANFLYFNNINNLFQYTRPYEALFRDPWWIYTCCSLIWNIKRRYEFGFIELVRVSPRFGVLIAGMMMSIAFVIVDILSVTHAIKGSGSPDGINPFWKLAFVFKCLTDTVVLDDFKTALDRLKQYRLERIGSVFTADGFNTLDSDRLASARHKKQDAPRNDSGSDPRVKSRDWGNPDFDIERLDVELREPPAVAGAERMRSASSG